MTAAQLMADLGRLRTLTFSARSGKSTGWSGQGHGEVRVETPSPNTIVFYESGQWQPAGREDRPALPFSNIYRWSLADGDTVRLEHLRQGPDQPVFLVELQPDTVHGWASVTPHVCSADLYALTLSVQPDGIDMHWTISGPKKDENIAYRYTFGA